MRATKLISKFALGLLALNLQSCATAPNFDSLTEKIGFPKSLLPSDKPVIQSVSSFTIPDKTNNQPYVDLYEAEFKYDGLADIPVVQAYLDSLLQEIVAASGFSNFKGKIYILADPNRLIANATAEGNILITLGFLKNVESEEELVNLLAHEFAHIALNHHNTGFLENASEQITTGLVILNRLQVMTEKNEADRGKSSPNKSQVLERNTQRSRFVADLVSNAISPTWSRSLEEDADRFALDVSIKLKHDYLGSGRLWLDRFGSVKQVGNFDTVSGNLLNQRFLDQISYAKKLMDSNPNEFRPKEGKSKFLIDSVASAAALSLLNSLAESHNSPDSRIDSVNTYYEKFYATADFEPISQSRFKRALQGPEMRSTLAAYRDADEAVVQMQKGQRKKALDLIQKAKAQKPKGHLYIWSRELLVYELGKEQRTLEKTYDLAATAGLKPRYPDTKVMKEKIKLLESMIEPVQDTPNVSLLSNFTNDSRSVKLSDSEKTQLLADIDAVRRTYALSPIASEAGKVPSIKVLLDKASYLRLINRHDEAFQLEKEIFEMYQRPGFLYPVMIERHLRPQQRNPGSVLEAHKLAVECGFLHSKQRRNCEAALNQF